MSLSFNSMFKIGFSGALIGVANLIPGVSGATLAVLTNQYERIISELSKLAKCQFNDLDIRYLGIIAIGAAIGIFGLSFPLHYAFVQFESQTYAVIFGLVYGSISGIQIASSKQPFMKRYANIYFVIGCIIMVALIALDNSSVQMMAINSHVLLFLAGIIAMAAMIVPGISGSMVLVIMGAYDLVLISVKTLDILALVPCILGAIIGGLTFLKGIQHCLNHWSKQFESLILGLVVGSMLFLMDQVPSISLFQWVIWVGIGALISQGTLQIAKRNEQR